MLIKRIIQTLRADAELPQEIRAALIKSLFAPVASLTAGAINGSIIGAAVAWSVGNRAIMATSAAIFAVGMLRVASAMLYMRYEKAADQPAIKRWERIYEAGAWAFSGLLGLLCWLTLMQTTDAALQMAVITTATGYAAAIAGRNAGRPFIAIGQFAFIMLPMVIALLIYPYWIHKVLGFVGLLFIYAMIDITLSIRDIIIQALTMTRKEAALAAAFRSRPTASTSRSTTCRTACACSTRRIACRSGTSGSWNCCISRTHRCASACGFRNLSATASAPEITKPRVRSRSSAI